MRRSLLLMLVAVALLGSSRVAAATAPPTDPTAPAATATATTIDNTFLDTERNLSECLNNSVDLPGCGHKPTQEGDRGGALQYATFALLMLGMAFIFWRVSRGVRARSAALADAPSSPHHDAMAP